MKNTLFTLLILAVAGIAFVAGYYRAWSPPIDTKEVEMERYFYQGLYETERDLVGHEAFRIIQHLDKGEKQDALAWLNLTLDSWITDRVVTDGWLESDLTWAGTLFLSKIGRHRAEHPVAYDDHEEEMWFSNVFQKSIDIDAKHYGPKKKPNKELNPTNEPAAGGSI